jgi:class 3 adenylate cyclase/tetratricopeptide (TPR) repeat protein
MAVAGRFARNRRRAILGCTQLDAVGQRRHLTLLFMDLCASSRLAERLEAEQFAAVLETLRRVCHDAVEGQRGRVVRMQGDGVLAIFGLPEPAEDDCFRAASAALEAQEDIDREHQMPLPDDLRPLQIHSGLHSGVVLLADGDIERGRFDVVGDAAHTAARLAQFAPAGAVLADLDSLGGHARHFALGVQTDLTLPGRTAPVRAAAITSRAPSARRPDNIVRPGLTPLAGRADVLIALEAQIKASQAVGGRRRIDIVGPPGVGKSRLLDELSVLPQLAGWQVLRGTCADESRSRPLHPFSDMVEADGMPPASGDLHGRLRAAAAQSPLLLLIDDWQWADDASRQLLARLLHDIQGLCAVLALRPIQDALEGGDGSASFVLSPLDETASSEIVERWLPVADPYTVAAIHRQAGGVPLFVEELARSRLARRGLLRDADQPGWLTQLVASRLSLLSLEQQEVIRTAAVLGSSFPRRLLATVGGWRERDLDWTVLAQGDFLFSAGGETVRFRHGLTRDAVYESVALHERRALHRRATRALAALDANPATLEALAYHAKAAGLWGEAADHAESAARQAMAAFAMDVARRHYQSALDALEGSGLGGTAALRRWCLLAHELGMTCIFDPLALPDVLPRFELCMERARTIRDPDLVARSAYWLGHICFGLGLLRRAAAHLREGLEVAAAAADARLAAQIQATLGQTLAAAGDYAGALPLMDSALAAKQRGARKGASVAVGSAFTLASKGGLLGDRGEFIDAQVQFDDAMALAGDSTHPIANSIRSWAMVVLVWQGRWSELATVSAESARRAHATQALLPLAISRACEGYGRWASSADEDGLRKLAAAVQWLEQRRGRFMSSIYHGWLVDALATTGDMAGARRQAAALFARARQLDTFGMGDGCRALALAAAATGNEARTARLMAYAERCAAVRGSRREAALNALCRARLALLRGDDAGALAHAAAAADAFDAIQMAWHAHSARALIGGHPAQVQDFAGASTASMAALVTAASAS